MLGWNEQELMDRPKNHPAKLALATRLLSKPTLTTEQIPGLPGTQPKIPRPRSTAGCATMLQWLLPRTELHPQVV
jgi:hypothetical protein